MVKARKYNIIPKLQGLGFHRQAGKWIVGMKSIDNDQSKVCYKVKHKVKHYPTTKSYNGAAGWTDGGRVSHRALQGKHGFGGRYEMKKAEQ